MNINQNISRLLIALKQKGKIYKINSFKFYSKSKYKYITKYQILKRELIPEVNNETEEIKFNEKYKVDYECYNKIALMQYLVSEYKEGSEADE